ncbi:hypothetical protein HYZ64_00670, partial [Candidatus Berkelbacteria bacterium]|nr:hypothetical protein [Candidatus Berkelbacteria bacterium]
MEKEEKSNSEEYEKSDLKKFSKEFSQEERAKTAAEIKAKRAEYFGLNKSLKEKLESLTQETNLKQEKVANIVKDILSLEEQVANYKDSRIRELLNFFEIKRISKELAVKRTTQESFEQDYETVNGLLQEIKEKMGDHHELEEAKDILANFYKSQSEKVREYEKEYESRLIPNIVKKHQAVFVHGIHPTFTPRENSLLKQGIDWKTKLKIALTLEPTLAASTIKKGDTPDNLWSRMGVILREGFVV